jgi:tRNA pseudouridine38-40 synthase
VRTERRGRGRGPRTVRRGKRPASPPSRPSGRARAPGAPRRPTGRPVEPGPAGTTYKLLIEYDGTSFHGWQQQKNAERTVAAALRRALGETGAQVLDLGAAGRTDAGVHALGQVAHLRLAEPREAEALRRAVNAALPASVHVLALAEAPPRFHARHDAVDRTYLYQLSRRRSALAKRAIWWVRRPLDVGHLRRATAAAVGRHDFRCFCEAPSAQSSTVVELVAAEVAEAGALVLVRLTASHFLWKMVRRLVGAFVQVATGELRLDELDALLAARPLPADRGGPATWTAPASGLFLEAVRYPGDGPLPPLTPVTPLGWEPRP